jgi:type IV pilus assembly protein PilF
MRVLKSKAIAALAMAALVAGCVAVNPKKQPSPKDAAEFNMQLGASYLRQGELQQAQAKLEKAIEQDPGLATAHTTLGLVYERLGDVAAAERQYRRAFDLKPADPDVLNSLASFLCLQQQKPDEALGYFQRALAIPLSRTYYNRAMLYTNAGVCAKRKDSARAEEYLRAALAADPSYSEALFQLADVTFSRGNFLQSRAFIERYLAAAPASPGALWLGFRVERALGEQQSARQYGERLMKEFPDAPETRQFIDQQRNAG